MIRLLNGLVAVAVSLALATGPAAVAQAPVEAPATLAPIAPGATSG